MNLKRSSIISAAAIMTLLSMAQVKADDVLLTLDLRNEEPHNALSGGCWWLYARKLETGTSPQGDHGISGIRAILANVDVNSICFADDINQMAGGPYTNTLANGTIEIVYGQNLGAPGVVTGVGVSANPNQDRLIASGSWLPGPRPVFSLDPQGFGSETSFLGGPSAPFPASIAATNNLTEVVTLGDLDNTGTVELLDVVTYFNVLSGSLPYNPAADIDQSGDVTNADTSLILDIADGPPYQVPCGCSIPEPTSLMLVSLGMLGLVTRRRR